MPSPRLGSFRAASSLPNVPPPRRCRGEGGPGTRCRRAGPRTRRGLARAVSHLLGLLLGSGPRGAAGAAPPVRAPGRHPGRRQGGGQPSSGRRAQRRGAGAGPGRRPPRLLAGLRSAGRGPGPGPGCLRDAQCCPAAPGASPTWHRHAAPGAGAGPAACPLLRSGESTFTYGPIFTVLSHCSCCARR